MRRLMAIVLTAMLACMAPCALADDAETSVRGVTLRIDAAEDTLLPGETAVFSVTVENGSGQELTGLTFSEISLGEGVWSDTVKTLADGASHTAAYTVRVTDALHDRALFEIRWAQGQVALQYALTVIQPVQLTITAEADDWPWETGKPHTANFTVHNGGDRPMEHVTLRLGQAYTADGDAGEATFLRKDRRKLKSAEQTAEHVIARLESGDSVTMTVQAIPAADLSFAESLSIPLQATVVMDGRGQTVAASCTVTREVVRPGMWTTIIREPVSVGHILTGLAALTVLIALAAVIRAKKLR